MMRMENRNPNSPMMKMKRHEYEDQLPEEVIREILLRLPVRLLLQLRSECRSWNSLISSHEFAMHHHLQRSTLTQPPPLLCWNHQGRDAIMRSHQLQPNTLFTPFPIDRSRIITGSCNGLLCLTEGFPFKTLTLFNPSTRSVSPSVPFKHSFTESIIEREAYCGFGYDTVHDKYKFVMGCCTLRHRRAIVFTFGANPSLKTVHIPVFSFHLADKKVGIFVSGTLHWIVYDHNRERFVLSFDLKTESFGRLCLPMRMYSDFSKKPHLQVFNNCLSVCYRPPSETILCTVWIMKEHGVEESWIKLFEIPLVLRISPRVSVTTLLYISKDHILLTLNGFNGRLFVYNLGQNQPIYPMPHGYYSKFLYLCHESLVSPSHYCGLEAIN